MNIAEYLKQNFPGGVSKVEEIVVDGVVKGYFARGINGDEIYLPAGVTGNVGMVSYAPGSGGSRQDAAALREIMYNDAPEYVISVARYCGDSNDCIETGYQMAKGANLNVTDNVTICFSASGFPEIGKLEEFQSNHPEVNCNLISCEPYGSYNIDNAVNLASNGANIIFAAPASGFHVNFKNTLENYDSKGLNTYLLGTNYNGVANAHVQTSHDIIASRLADYILGYKDSFDTSLGGGYSFLKYDENVDGLVNFDYSELSNSRVLIPDISKINSIDDFNIEVVSSPVNEKYAGLKYLKDFESSGETVMATDYGYSLTKMNEIRSMVRSSSFLNGVVNHSFRSSSGIPGCIAGYINAYFDIVGSLMNSISLETDSVMSYADAVVMLDNDLAKEAEGVGTIVTDGKIPNYIPIGLDDYDKSDDEKKNIDKNTDTTNDNNKNEFTGSKDISKIDTSSKVDNNTNSDYVSGGFISTVNSTILEPKYIYDFDGYQGLIYMDGDTIKEVKYRYTFDSSSIASSKISEIKDKYKDSSFVGEIIQDDRYIDVKFKDDVLQNKTADNIIEEFFEGGKIHG